LRAKYSIPISIDNDANAAAIAELIAGNGQHLDNFVYITLGTGIGGAIIINRKIYHGAIGGAGEIGHLIIDADFFDNEIPTYRNGIIEEKIGRSAIIKLAKKLISKNPNTKLQNINFDVADISKFAEEKDIVAVECLAIIGRYLAKGIVSINHILDISNFIIGGGISQSELLINVAKETASAYSLPSVSEINIVRAKFLNNTGIIGAALLGKGIV
jgi:glucokinase